MVCSKRNKVKFIATEEGVGSSLYNKISFKRHISILIISSYGSHCYKGEKCHGNLVELSQGKCGFTNFNTL